MKLLFYKTFLVNQTKSLPPFVVILCLCVLPLPWQQVSLLYPLFLSSLPVLLLLLQDQKDRWYELLSTFPLSPYAVLGEKYLLAGISSLLFPLSMFAGQKISCFLPEELEPTPEKLLFTIAFLLIFHALFLFILFRWGPHRVLPSYFLGAAVCLLAPLSSWMFSHPVLFLGAALLVLLVSFLAAVRLYPSRRW